MLSYAIKVDWTPSSMNCDELDDKFCVGRSRFAYYRGSCFVACLLSFLYRILYCVLRPTNPVFDVGTDIIS